jgi:HPt (histidine-containing phosphotransfer) domain-containing protein
MMPPEAIVHEPLDPTMLANLRRLEAATGETLLPRLLASFAAVTPPRLAALREAIATGDAHAVNQGAHTLNGSSANLGARHLAKLCEDLEMLGQTSDLSHAVSILASIEVEFLRVRMTLEQEFTRV